MTSTSISFHCTNGHYARASLSSHRREKSPAVWTSKWIVGLSDGSIKIYNVTLFNGKKSNQKYLNDSPQTTYLQIDDISIPKERKLKLIGKEGVVYSIDPNNFQDLKINLNIGKTTKSKQQIFERLFVIYDHLLDLP